MTTVDRILVPVDFSPSSEAALTYAAAMAERFFSEIDVLHVWRSPATSSAALSPREWRLEFEGSAFGRQMRNLLERFEDRGVLLPGRIKLSDDEAETIIGMARTEATT